MLKWFTAPFLGVSRVLWLLAAALLALLGVQTARLHSAHAWRDEVVQATREAAHRPKLAPKNVARQVRTLGAAIDQARLASAQSEIIARKAKAARESADETNRREHDDGLQTKLDAAYRAGAAYAAAHRLRGPGCPADPVRGEAGRSDLPVPGAGAAQPDRPGGPAELVAVSRADLDRCTVIATRLLDARDWNAQREAGD